MIPTVEPLWGCARPTSPYLEGHPRLPAAEAADAIAKGYGRCTWRWRVDDAPFARADCVLLPDGFVLISLDAQLPNCDVDGMITAEVKRAKNYDDKRTFSLFICPMCKRSCRNLVYNFRWRCDDCSGLLYRSQRIQSKVAAWERRDELERIVARGRPKGMHQRTFRRLLAEHEELVRKLGSDRAFAPAEYLFILERTWGPIPRPAVERPREEETKAKAASDRAAAPLIIGSLGPVGSSLWLDD